MNGKNWTNRRGLGSWAVVTGDIVLLFGLVYPRVMKEALVKCRQVHCVGERGAFMSGNRGLL